MEMLKTSVSAVKKIGQRFVIKGILNRKFGSGRPRTSAIKYDYRLERTVLMCVRKQLLSTAKI